MDPDRPAPGRLELVRHLLNSDDRFHGIDYAEEVDALNRYLARTGAHQYVVERDELPAFRALRDTVRAFSVSPNRDVIASFNAVAQQHPLVVRFDDRRSSLRPQDSGASLGLAGLFGETLGAVHEAIVTDHWWRLRACQRYDCAWIYYDSTASGAMRWCSTDPCGNVMKTRAYRSRTARKKTSNDSLGARN